MLSTTNDEKSNYPEYLASEQRKALLREIADLTGERFTVECRLQYINNRIDAIRQALAADRQHGNSKG